MQNAAKKIRPEFVFDSVVASEVSARLKNHVFSNAVSGRYFIVKFRVSVTNTAFTREELIAFELWALDCVAHIDLKDECDQPAMKVVFDYQSGLADYTSDSEWKFEEEDDLCIKMLVYNTDDKRATLCSSDMVIDSEDPVTAGVSAKCAANPFLASDDGPELVTDIGVSGVSEELMMRQWWGVVSYNDSTTESGTDRWGFRRGYMVHTMWMVMPDGDFCGVREMSFSFSWLNYDTIQQLSADGCHAI